MNNFFPVPLFILGISVIGCQDSVSSDTNHRNPIAAEKTAENTDDGANVENDDIVTWKDLACSKNAECEIKTVPDCCGEKMGLISQCVNKDFVPPTTTDCAGNDVCIEVAPFDYCVCASLEGAEEYGMLCQGRLADSGV